MVQVGPFGTFLKDGLPVEVMHFYCSFWDFHLMLMHFARYPSSVNYKNKLNHFIFTSKISNRVAGKRPRCPFRECIIGQFLRRDQIF